MTEPIAINRYELTKKLFDEGIEKVTSEQYGKFAKRGVLILAAAWLILAAVTLIMRQNPIYIAVEFVIVLLAALWLSVYLPSRKKRSAWKKIKERCGDDLERTSTVYDDRIDISAAGNITTIRVENIVQTMTTDRLLILITSDRAGVLLKRNSFIKGCEDDVLSLTESAE